MRRRSLLVRSVIRLRNWARSIIGRRVRHLRVRSRMRNVVVSARLLVLRRRMRHITILRRPRLLIVLRRTRAIGLRRAVGGWQTRPLYPSSIQISRLRRCDYRRTSLVPSRKLGGIPLGCLLVLDLR